MRQTSRAVALLLALDSAQAVVFPIASENLINNAIYPNLMVPLGGANWANAGQLASRTAAYNNCPGWAFSTTNTTPSCAPANYNKVYHSSTAIGAWKTFAGQAVTAPGAASANELDAVSGVGSYCVPCIQQTGVWCSRTYSYSLVSTATLFQFESSESTNKYRRMNYIWTNTNTAYDNGSCCGSRVTMTQTNTYKITGAKADKEAAAAAPTGTSGNNLLSMNKYACVAYSSGQTKASSGATPYGTTFDPQALAGSATYNVSATRWSWWCSNGLYNQIQDVGTSGTAPVVYPNILQTLPDNANQRYELALVGCPQLVATCGVATQDVDALSAASARPLTSATMLTSQKCTWVGFGMLSPPAFVIDKGTGSGSKTAGLNAGSSWTIHHMEYNNFQLTEQADKDYNTYTGSIDITSKVPQFTMKYETYSKQRTWYGMGGSVHTHDNWNSPYQNGAADGAVGLTGNQYYGSVASFASSVAGTDYTDSASAATMDQRVIRYLPMQVAMNDNAMGAAVATKYNTSKTSYDSAKTMWNNYVAILTKNAKVDAFAAAFAPPKAPTVPPLPSMPWMPDVSATLRPLSTEKANSQIAYPDNSATPPTLVARTSAGTITKALQPATTDFWIADESVPLATGGGWGSFTAAVLKFRAGWGKSYGTIGYNKTADSTMGAVYQAAWQCGSTTAGGACPKTYTGSLISAAGTATSTVVANKVKFYVAISLWSTQNSSTGTWKNYAFVATCDTGTSADASCFKLSWVKGTWGTAISKLAAPASMTAATAADALTGIVGAQALAASAAAAFAAAAALY